MDGRRRTRSARWLTNFCGRSIPTRRDVIENVLIDTGRWEGRVEQRTRAGDTLAVDARWALQHDRLGKPLDVLETHTDVY